MVNVDTEITKYLEKFVKLNSLIMENEKYKISRDYSDFLQDIVKSKFKNKVLVSKTVADLSRKLDNATTKMRRMERFEFFSDLDKDESEPFKLKDVRITAENLGTKLILKFYIIRDEDYDILQFKANEKLQINIATVILMLYFLGEYKKYLKD